MLSTNLKVYRADATTGRPTATVVSSGVVQNVFPHATSAQRTAGLVTDVKTFWGLDNTDNLALLDPEAYHDKPTLSPNDYVVMWLSTMRTTPAGLAAEMAAADKRGTAILQANIAIGALTFTVTVKNALLLPGGTYDIFKDTYKIKVCSHSDALATDGAEEIKTIDGTPTISGLNVTITVTEAFAAAFTANGVTRCSSLIKPGDTETSVTVPVVTSAAGTADFSTYPIILDNQGTQEQDWTLTFTDAIHFNLTGDVLTTPIAGLTTADFAPNNPGFTRPYFTIETEAWGGTFSAGDTVTFTTHPARVPIGQRRIVPAGSASLANNKCTQVYGGEAAA